MPAPTLSYFDPGADITAHCTTAVQAQHFAYFAAPGDTEQVVNVSNAPAEDGHTPAGVAGYDQAQGGYVHVKASGVLPVVASSDAVAGAPAYADGTTVTAEEGGAEEGSTPRPRVGTFVRPVASGDTAVIKLNLS